MQEKSDTEYKNFNYALHADKILNTQDGDIDVLLKTYNISHKTLEEMMSSIREWYEKQPHLPQGQLHDRIILGQLISRGFSVEQCKEKIDNYFFARHKMPELLCNCDPLQPNIINSLKKGYWITSPYKTKENDRIVTFRVSDPENISALDLAKLGLLMNQYRLFNDTSAGLHFVMDLSNSTIKNVMDVNPLLFAKLNYYFTSCYAVKVKGIHLVNIPTFAMSLFGLVKKMMKAKHLSRLHLYDSFETLFTVLPKEVFPKDLGGTADLTSQEICDNWCEALTSHTWRNFFFHAENHFITDETKRIGPSRNGDSFGLDGSFRKLELD